MQPGLPASDQSPDAAVEACLTRSPRTQQSHFSPSAPQITAPSLHLRTNPSLKRQPTREIRHPSRRLRSQSEKTNPHSPCSGFLQSNSFVSAPRDTPRSSGKGALPKESYSFWAVVNLSSEQRKDSPR